MEGFAEAADIGVVEGGIDLVEHTEGAGFDHIDPEEQGHGGHGALSPGEEGHAFQAGTGGAGDNFEQKPFRNVLIKSFILRVPAVT